MSASRRSVLRTLAALTDAETGATVPIAAVAADLDAEVTVVEDRLASLKACHLATIENGGLARVTITGEELLEIDPDAEVIVGTPEGSRG